MFNDHLQSLYGLLGVVNPSQKFLYMGLFRKLCLDEKEISARKGLYEFQSGKEDVEEEQWRLMDL